MPKLKSCDHDSGRCPKLKKYRPAELHSMYASPASNVIQQFFFHLLPFSYFLNPYEVSYLCRIGVSIPRYAYSTVAYRTRQSVVDQHRKKVVATV